MSFLEAAKARSAGRYGVRCDTCKFVDTIEQPLQAELVEALAMHHTVVDAAAIRAELLARGFTSADIPSQDSIRRHRRDCGVVQ